MTTVRALGQGTYSGSMGSLQRTWIGAISNKTFTGGPSVSSPRAQGARNLVAVSNANRIYRAYELRASK